MESPKPHAYHKLLLKLIPDTPDITSNQTDSVPVSETCVYGFRVKISPKVNRTLEIPTSRNSHTTDCLSLPELLRSRHRLQRHTSRQPWKRIFLGQRNKTNFHFKTPLHGLLKTFRTGKRNLSNLAPETAKSVDSYRDTDEIHRPSIHC